MSSNTVTFPDLSSRSPVLCTSVGGLGLLIWLVWFSWDTRTYVDEFGNQSEPYEPWQVVGCVITLTLVLIAAQVAGADRLLSSLALCVTFTLGFSISGALSGSPDDPNLFLAGAFFILIGMSLVAGVISMATWAAARRGSLRS